MGAFRTVTFICREQLQMNIDVIHTYRSVPFCCGNFREFARLSRPCVRGSYQFNRVFAASS
jgi:hypothetical protein